MTLPLWLDRPGNNKIEEVDVAIIGGGIMGAGAAYWLSRRAGLKSALFEAGQVAGGASGRNAGFVLRGIHNYYNYAVKTYGRDTSKFIFRFTEESQVLLSEFAQSVGNSFEYERAGSYLLAASLEEMQDLDETAELMSEDGFEVEYLKADPIERNFYGAIHNAGDGVVHPAKLVKALLEASRIRVYENEPVIRIDNEGDKGLTILTPNKTVRCGKIMIAANAYGPLMEQWFFDKVKPVRGQILVTRPLKSKILDKCCYANYGWEYFRQLPDRRLLLGGCREFHIEDEVGYADIVTPEVQSSLEHYLKDRFPETAGVAIDYRWSGIMGFTEDGLPLAGELPTLPGAYFIAGCNGHGVSYGLNMSRLLVEMALDGRNPGIFSAGRLDTKSAASKIGSP